MSVSKDVSGLGAMSRSPRCWRFRWPARRIAATAIAAAMATAAARIRLVHGISAISCSTKRANAPMLQHAGRLRRGRRDRNYRRRRFDGPIDK